METLNTQKSEDLVSEWVYSYGDDLFRWAYHKTSDKVIAEDLVQETYLSAITKIDSFRGDSTAKTWLFRILNNKIIDYYRKTAKDIMTSESKLENDIFQFTETMFDSNGNWKANGFETAWENEEHLLDNPDFNEIMKICLDDLPPKWRLSVIYKYLEEKDSKVICQDLGITTSNYWQMLHRAKLLLKKCIEMKWLSPI